MRQWRRRAAIFPNSIWQFNIHGQEMPLKLAVIKKTDCIWIKTFQYIALYSMQAITFTNNFNLFPSVLCKHDHWKMPKLLMGVSPLRGISVSELMRPIIIYMFKLESSCPLCLLLLKLPFSGQNVCLFLRLILLLKMLHIFLCFNSSCHLLVDPPPITIFVFLLCLLQLLSWIINTGVKFTLWTERSTLYTCNTFELIFIF